MRMKSSIPWTMVAFRAALGPIVVLGERCHWNGLTLAGIVLAALLSDIFDGVLARRWNTDTAALRLSDSLADTSFYLCVAVAIGLGMPVVWHACRTGVLIVLGCEISRFVFDLIKFGKPASYHSYLAKLWGFVLATAVIVTFATQHASVWMSAAILLGILCNAESLAMSLILPAWRRDVKTFAAAARLRASLLREPIAAAPAMLPRRADTKQHARRASRCSTSHRPGRHSKVNDRLHRELSVSCKSSPVQSTLHAHARPLLLQDQPRPGHWPRASRRLPRPHHLLPDPRAA